jgi:hypothetical protein
MYTIKNYRLPADAEGYVEIRMPEPCYVLGVSQQGRAIVVLSNGNDDPERYVLKKFVVVLEGEDAGRASGHRYLGDLFRETSTRFVTQYVFEWMHPKAP